MIDPASLEPPAQRFVAGQGYDDRVLPFAVEPLDVRGRVVRLGEAIDQILGRHDYPLPVARLVGEAAALTVLLGTSLKIDGRFQLQTRSDGAVGMLVVDFDSPDKLRAFARFDMEKLAAQNLGGALLGNGHLAFTVDRGTDVSRYQGIVALAGQGLEEAAHQYFRQSEQIPTRVRLAVAQNVTGTGATWRAGGLLLQFLPAAPERQRQVDLDPGDPPDGLALAEPSEDDAWTEAKALAATIEDHELVDPTLSSERLLYRLFHERGVKVFNSRHVQSACRCSNERIRAMLRNFSASERRDMIGENGKIGVTCEFCSSYREFDPADFNDA